MRVLVLSDIHANYTALQSVLADAGDFDALWCLGDVVGYGPEPNACADLLSRQPDLTCVLGNHDIAALGRIPIDTFNDEARRSLLWQARILSQQSIDFLSNLPEKVQVSAQITLVHASPRDPIWEYVLNTLTAQMNFSAFDTDFCFIGHTHIQSIFHWDEKQNRVIRTAFDIGRPLALQGRFIINPGSVGQPRDGDPRAAYGIFDTERLTWEPRRAAYDIEAVQDQIRKRNLPERHALRLAEGR